MVTNETTKTKEGLFRFGLVANLKQGVFLKELHHVIEGAVEELPTSQELREIADAAETIYLNSSGYPQDRDGSRVTESTAKFIAFNTGYQTLDGEDVYGWFEKEENGVFVGVNWNSLSEIRTYASVQKFQLKSFKMGKFYFKDLEDCNTFLEDLAGKTIHEDWNYKKKPSKISAPILRSYIQTLFSKLEQEQKAGEPDKIIRSKDGSHIIFNTNLLDHFFNDEYIIAEVKKISDTEEVYINLVRISKDSGSDLIKYGFPRNVAPKPPKFFENVNEVIFHPEYDIEKSYQNLDHIIKKRLFRFPEEMRGLSSEYLASKLYNAIDYALAIAQRNYKYIVPIYYPRFDTISFIMPIFLERSHKNCPDFALVLQNIPPVLDSDGKVVEEGYYVARTILDLEDGYQDARVIAKPDESWLNPGEIK